jgi:hypothetical protein
MPQMVEVHVNGSPKVPQQMIDENRNKEEEDAEFAFEESK